MEWFIELVGKAVLAVGGAGVIVVAVSSYISKIWAEVFMKQKVAEYDKQIEYYKSSLELEREKYKALYEQIIHKNNKIFDTEFEMYKDISLKLTFTVNAFTEWITTNKLSDDSYKKYAELHNELNITLAQYSAFIDRNLYNEICDYLDFLKRKTDEIKLDFFEKYSNYVKDKDPDFKVHIELSTLRVEVKDKREKISDLIRKALRNSELNEGIEYV